MIWQTKKLGEVCIIARGGSPRPINQYMTNSKDGINWVKISDATSSTKYIYTTKEKIAKEGLHKTRLVEPGDFILTNSMSFGRPYIMKTTGAIHDGWLLLRPDKKLLDEEYLYHFLSSNEIYKQFKKLASGAVVQNLNSELVRGVEITFPSLSEQKKIVKMLDEKMAKIAEAKRLREAAIADTEKILPRTLHEIFEEGKLNEWEEKEVGDICEHPQYGFTASSSRQLIGPKMLRITDIQEGRVNWETVPYCRCSDVKKYQLSKGDIVFARTGATVGKSFLIGDVPKQAIYASYLIRLRAKKAILPEFLYYFFQSSDYWKQITDGQVGGAQPNVNGSKLVKIKLVVPSISNQKKIVTRLDKLSARVREGLELQKSQLADLKALEKACLREAFNPE